MKPAEAQPKVRPDRPNVSASDASNITEITDEEKELKDFMSKLQGDDSSKGKSLKMMMDAYKRDGNNITPSGKMMQVKNEDDEINTCNDIIPRLSMMKKGKRALLDSGANHAATSNIKHLYL